MREIGTSGSEGGGGVNASPYPYPALQRADDVAAVDREHAAGHEGARLRGQQQERAVEMLGLADAALRNAFDQALPGRSFPEIAVHLGLDVAGTDRVDPNVI